MGVDAESKGYRVYWASQRRISVERNVTFAPTEVMVAEDVLSFSPPHHKHPRLHHNPVLHCDPSRHLRHEQRASGNLPATMQGSTKERVPQWQ